MSSYYVLKIQYVNRPPETRNISAPTTAVGRESGDIVLNDPQTSGRHAEVVFQGGQVRVRDAGSTNGTWFNGQRLTDFAMEPGQWFQVGQTTLQLMAVHGAAAPGPAPGPAKTMMAMGAPPPAAGPASAPGSAPVGWAPPGGAAPAPAPAPAPVAAAPAPAPGYPPAGGGYPPSQPAAPGYPPSQPAAPGYPPPAAPGMAPAPGMGPGAAPGMAPAPGMSPGPAPGMAPGPGYPAPGMAPGQPAGPPPGYPAPGMAPGHPPGPAPGMAPNPAAMAPMGAAPAIGPPPGMAPMGMGGGGVRPKFQGSGGELLVTVLLGLLLCLVTVYIYLPWFVCKMARYVANNTTLGPTRRGELRVEFTGTGGELFVAYLVGMLLTIITLGIYTPWFICKMIKFFTENTQAVAPDGTRYRLGFEGTGGELFVTYLVGTLLTSITLGIYMPWFLCKLTKWGFGNARILENEQPVGSLDFEGTGGELFVTYLVGVLLISITFGIYMPWFSVKMTKFFAEGTRVTYQGRVFQGHFHGTGGELFVIMLLHGFLTSITIGIYMPWYLVKQWEFGINNREYTEIGGAGAGMGGPAFQPNMPQMQMPMR